MLASLRRFEKEVSGPLYVVPDLNVAFGYVPLSTWGHLSLAGNTVNGAVSRSSVFVFLLWVEGETMLQSPQKALFSAPTNPIITHAQFPYAMYPKDTHAVYTIQTPGVINKSAVAYLFLPLGVRFSYSSVTIVSDSP